MFSLILGVIGFQNYTMKTAEEQIVIIASRDYPGVEYESIGRFWGNIIAVVRMSLGDNDFAATVKMDDNSIAILFWFIWVIIAYLNCIIFMNFIIAEASESYGKVMSNIENNLYLQKINLINESEEMMPKGMVDDQKFPKFLIVREMEL